MSGDDDLNKYDDPRLTGLSRYFNSTTIKGRANVAIATYAAIVGYIIYAKFLKTKCPECPAEIKKNRYAKWNRVRNYLSHYVSEKDVRNLKEVSLTTLSFLSGFFFYSKIVRGFILENEYSCYCKNVKRSEPICSRTNKNGKRIS